jgi:hypothetical protein
MEKPDYFSGVVLIAPAVMRDVQTVSNAKVSFCLFSFLFPVQLSSFTFRFLSFIHGSESVNASDQYYLNVHFNQTNCNVGIRLRELNITQLVSQGHLLGKSFNVKSCYVLVDENHEFFIESTSISKH